MKSGNSVLSVILSICIILSAVVFVSADISSDRLSDSVKKDADVGLGYEQTTEAEQDTAGVISPVENDANSFGETEDGGNANDAAYGYESVEKENANVDNENQNINESYAVNAAEHSSLAVKTEINAVFDYEYTNTVYTASDTNSYIYKPDGRGTIVCKLTHEDLSAGGFKAQLYMRYSPNGDGKSYEWRLINELETTSQGDTYKSAEIGVAAGQYKLVVSSLNSAVPDKNYTLEVTFTSGTDFETEYNDTVTRYNEIIPGRAVRGSASYLSDGKDRDWYMFRVYEDGAVTLTFDHAVKNLATVCWKITVYDSDGNEIYADNSYFSTSSRRSGRIGVEKGCYYICIENRVYYDATYTLTVRRYTELPYESENNDVKEKADIITPGIAVTGELSSRSSGSDIDWYKFTLDTDGVCTFNFSHEADADEVKNVQDGETPKNGWRMTVMSESGATVYSMKSTWDSTGTLSPYVGLGAGTYYIMVDSADLYHNTTPYTVNVSFESSKSWEHEPNNSISFADKLTPFNPVYASLSSYETDYDTDWFSFTLTQKSRVSVELGHEVGSDANSVFIFELYDSSLKKAALTDETGKVFLTSGSVSSFRNQKSAYAYSTLEPGTYYVKVVPGLYYDSMRYSITLTVSEV